ncbi:hypothetical protein ACOACQ_21880 [Nocardioides sp. CPCC 206347]|uniref:hypothetical protein n=1 Tax=Nocardioides sp. CPCC 206347 TaxID=3406463 RepID=UPI003B43CDCC
MMTSVRVAAAVTALLLPLSACSSTSDDNTRDLADEFSEVEALPFNASGLLGGNARPEFPAGDSGEMSVVQVGPLVTTSGSLLFAFRNNTDDAISQVKWTASARSGGKIVSTGSSAETIPAQVASGEVGLAYIDFENADSIPSNVEYEFSTDSAEIDISSLNAAPLTVTETNIVGNSIVGEAKNETGVTTAGPYLVSIYCFIGTSIVGYKSGPTWAHGTLDDGDTVTFVVKHGDECASYVVGVGGHLVLAHAV